MTKYNVTPALTTGVLLIVMFALLAFAPVALLDAANPPVALLDAAPTEQVTPDAPDATLQVDDDVPIVVEGGGTLIVEQLDSDRDATSAILNLLGFVLVAAAGGGSFAIIWERVRKSKEAKDNAERLFEALSPTWQTTIHRALDLATILTRAAQSNLALAREITDGAPNVEGIPSATYRVEGTPETGMSVFVSEDGGKTWRPIPAAPET